MRMRSLVLVAALAVSVAACSSAEPAESSTTASESTTSSESAPATSSAEATTSEESEAPKTEESSDSEEPAADRLDAELRAMLPAAIRAANAITVAVTPTYPPYEYVEEDGGDVIGINAEVMEAVGEILGVDIKYEKVAVYAATLTGIEAGRYDAGIIYQDTIEREKAVDIVSFYEDGTSFVARTDDEGLDKESPMCGRTVDVGTSGLGNLIADILQEELCTSKGLPLMNLLHSTDSNQQFIALSSGRADFITVSPAVGAMLGRENDGKYTVVTGNLHPLPTGIAVNKSLRGLSETLVATLQKMIDSGEMHDIFEAWDADDLLIEKAGINLTGAMENNG
jgi:polar amino acid transport system substrate-binding protein